MSGWALAVGSSNISIQFITCTKLIILFLKLNVTAIEINVSL